MIEALQKLAGAEYMVGENSVRSLRTAYKQTQIASVRLPTKMARNNMDDRGKTRIGLANCGNKCFRCWHLEHITVRCKSHIDRSKQCMKCGFVGHRIAQYEKQAHCVLCLELGKEDNDSQHISSSFKCAVIAAQRKQLSNKR